VIDEEDIDYEDDDFDDDDIFGPDEPEELRSIGAAFDGALNPIGKFDGDIVGSIADGPLRGKVYKRPVWRGEGLRVELRAIPGVTSRDSGLYDKPYRFQAPPLETFRVDSAIAVNDYSTVQNGIYTQMGDKELTVVSFSTLSTIAPEPWVVNPRDWNLKRRSRRLRRILSSKSPFRLVAWHPAKGRHRVVELNMKATLRSLGIEERAGEGDAKYYDVEFVQWRDPIQRRKRRKARGRGNREDSGAFTYHRLKANDTLASVAQKKLGSISQVGYVRHANPLLKEWGRNTPIVKHKHYRVWTPKLDDKERHHGLLQIPTETPSGGVEP
jgi:hypothetical protein